MTRQERQALRLAATLGVLVCFPLAIAVGSLEALVGGALAALVILALVPRHAGAFVPRRG